MDMSIMIDYLPQYLSGAGVTLRLTAEALLLGLMGGLFVALCKMSNIKVVRALATCYISVIRGTPLLSGR